MINAFENRGQKVDFLPLVPLRDVVVFPYTMIPFVVGRKSSLVAVEKALLGDKRIFLATQRDAKIDDPKPDEINFIGTIANIVQSLKLPNRSEEHTSELQSQSNLVCRLLLEKK